MIYLSIAAILIAVAILFYVKRSKPQVNQANEPKPVVQDTAQAPQKTTNLERSIQKLEQKSTKKKPKGPKKTRPKDWFEKRKKKMQMAKESRRKNRAA